MFSINENPNKPIIIWLLTGCALIFLMVVIGGITRLTNSGLSIVEWDLIMGTFPPLTENHWDELFLKYQQTPEYQLVNHHFALDEFKEIFWWEYLHRLLGRVLGLVFIIPFIYFYVKKKLEILLIKKLLIIFLIGGFQGFLGWYMVKSGLNKNPDVSHYRLAAHLIAAFVSFGFTFWVALELIYPPKKSAKKINHPGLRKWTYLLLILILLQVIYGAFVAGLNAGVTYNTFPMMGDEWISESVGFSFQKYGWKSTVENGASVQFIHRMLAYLLVILVSWMFYYSTHLSLTDRQKTIAKFLVYIVSFQFFVGVIALILVVPISLGILHQAGAFVLFGAAVFLLQQLKR